MARSESTPNGSSREPGAAGSALIACARCQKPNGWAAEATARTSPSGLQPATFVRGSPQYVSRRLALVENEQRIRQAARNLRRFLETGPEKLHNVVPLMPAFRSS